MASAPKYWIYVKCSLCKVGMGEAPTRRKKLDGTIAHSMCSMCIARKYKGRGHAFLVSVPGCNDQIKPKEKEKGKQK